MENIESTTLVVNKDDEIEDIICIEYPGIVNNIENMLETLGGNAKISHTLCENKKRMELKLNPYNIYSKPAYGDIHKTGGLLLKIKIQKSNDSINNSMNNSDEGPIHKVEVLGKIRQIVRFNGLCDLQYLPLSKNSDKSVSYIFDQIVPKAIPDLEWFEENVPPLLPIPGLFSRNDTVAQNIHRGLRRDNLSDDVIAVVRNKNTDSVEIISFNLTDSIPKKPDARVLQRLQIKYVTDKDLINVKKCFEMCPIWNRMGLRYETRISHDKLKCILPSLAYYFTTGPWRTMYVRFGYDPRKDFKSRFYQTFDWRMRKDYGLNEYIAKKRELENVIKQKKAGVTTSKSIGNDVLSYPYLEEGRLPSARQCMFRYCDLRFPKIKEMLENIHTPLSGAKCHIKHGWLPIGFEEECRELIWSSITHLAKQLRQNKNNSVPQSKVVNKQDVNLKKGKNLLPALRPISLIKKDAELLNEKRALAKIKKNAKLKNSSQSIVVEK